MGRSPHGNSCKDGSISLKKGAWTPEEDEKLIEHINQHGYGNWRALPKKCGLQRCGKSCRLRWTNYLRPDIKRGAFTPSEEQKIIQLHALVGNKWAFIASQLPKRTDNEIKNYWNTVLKKRFSQKMWWSSAAAPLTSLTAGGSPSAALMAGSSSSPPSLSPSLSSGGGAQAEEYSAAATATALMSPSRTSRAAAGCTLSVLSQLMGGAGGNAAALSGSRKQLTHAPQYPAAASATNSTMISSSSTNMDHSTASHDLQISCGQLNMWMYNRSTRPQGTGSSCTHDPSATSPAACNSMITTAANASVNHSLDKISKGINICATGPASTASSATSAIAAAATTSSATTATSHLAQWETARLEAETRLAQQSACHNINHASLNILKPKPKPKPNLVNASNINMQRSSNAAAAASISARAGSIDRDPTAFPCTAAGFNLNMMNSAPISGAAATSSCGSPLTASLAAHAGNLADPLCSDPALNPKYSSTIDAKSNATTITTSTSTISPTSSFYIINSGDCCDQDASTELDHQCSNMDRGFKAHPMYSTLVHNIASSGGCTDSAASRPAAGALSSNTALLTALVHDHIMEQYSSNNLKQLSVGNNNDASSGSYKLSTPSSGRLSWSKHDLTLPNLIPPNAWCNNTTTNTSRDPQHQQQLQQSTASPPSSSSSSSCLHLRRTASSCSNSGGVNAAATNAISTSSGDRPRPKLDITIMNIDRSVQAADPDHGDVGTTAADPDHDGDHHLPSSDAVIDLGNMINPDHHNVDLKIYNSAFNSMIDIMSIDPTNDIGDGETNDGGSSEDANNVNDLNEEENDHVSDPLDDICDMLALPSPKNTMQISNIPGIMGTTSSCCSTANSSSVMSLSGALDHNNISAVTSTMVQALSFQQIETLMLGGEQANHHDTQFSNLLMDLNLC